MRPGLSFRVLAPTAMIAALLLAVGIGGAWYVYRLHARIAGVLRYNTASIRAAEELILIFRDCRLRWTQAKHDGDGLACADEVMAMANDANFWLVAAEKASTSAEEDVLLRRVRAGSAIFFRYFDRASRGNTPPATDLAMEEKTLERVVQTEILGPAQSYLDLNERLLQETMERNEVLANYLVVGLFGLGVLGAAAGLILGIGITRGLNNYLIRLTIPIQNAAGKLGEVVRPIRLSGSNPPGDLEELTCRLAEEVGRVVTRLRDSERDTLRSEQLAALGTLAAGMAHELRNPLTAIKMLVQSRIQSAKGPMLTTRQLEVLQEEVTRLEQLVQSFLDFARPPKPEWIEFDLVGLINQTVELARHRVREPEVRLEVRAGQAPTMVRADLGMLRQLTHNLLTNAIDAVGDHGQVTVTIDEATVGPSGVVVGERTGRPRQTTFTAATRLVLLEVEDNGVGLPDALDTSIFEPFVSSKEAGVGLGLSICRRIVEMHGGRLTACRGPGGGAIFSAELPVVGGANGAAAQREREGEALTGAT